jgi:hypothetical protein
MHNSALAVKNNFFEDYADLAWPSSGSAASEARRCHVPVTPHSRPAPWYRRGLNGGVGGLRRPAL